MRSQAARGTSRPGRSAACSSSAATTGQGSGTKRPIGSGACSSNATRIRFQPRRKTRTHRRRVACRIRGCRGTKAVTSGTVLAGIVSSASPPTLSSHRVATATASHRRAARSGFVIWVRCPCQPARFVIWKPCSLQARTPYQQAVLASGGRSGRINHGSLSPASQHASRVQWSWRWRPLKALPVPCQAVPGSGTNVFRGPPRPCPLGRQVPPVLMRKKGCQPRRVMRRNSQRAYKPRSASQGTKQGSTGSAQRAVPRLAVASEQNARNCWRTGGSLRCNHVARNALTAVNAQERARTMPRLHSASTVAWGLLKWGRWVWMVSVHSITRGWQDIEVLLRSMGYTQPPIPCPMEGCLVTSSMMSYRHLSKNLPQKGCDLPPAGGGQVGGGPAGG